jgi:queuine tRNA-ribosyltransferase
MSIIVRSDESRRAGRVSPVSGGAPIGSAVEPPDLAAERRHRVLRTRRGDVALPAFLPDATRGVVRAVDAADLEACRVPALMMNAFHLQGHPGIRLVQSVGGAHAFAGWRRPVFADSGGFQVFSLIRQNPSFGTITRDGAIFRPAAGDRKRILTPEKAIQAQLQMGADVVTCLDDCTDESAPREEQEAAVARTVAWARRCRAEFDRLLEGRRAGASDRPLLYAVIQGGNNRDLRRACAEALLELGFDGYGLGGWPLDENHCLLGDIIEYTASLVPEGTPLHGLGIGKPENIVACARFGYSTFDCALPTRDARHGRLYVFSADSPIEADLSRPDFYRAVYIDDERNRTSARPLSEACDCLACSRYSRAYLHHLHGIRDPLYLRLATIHNLRFYSQLMEVIGGGWPDASGNMRRPGSVRLTEERPEAEASDVPLDLDDELGDG